MTEPTDPIGERRIKGADRLNYSEGMMLDARDFADEQSYHRSRLARALQYLFGTGTVVGLRVAATPEPAVGPSEEVSVSPGIALDPMGRVVEVPRSACLRLDRWWSNQEDSALAAAFVLVAPPPLQQDPVTGLPMPMSGVLVDVFVSFHACGHGKTPAFAGGPFDATDALALARIRDGYHLDLVLRDEAAPPVPPDTAQLAANRAADLPAWKQAVLDGWREDDDDWSQSGPDPLNEHPAGADTRSVLLARVLIPADPPAPDTERPLRRADPLRVDNLIRRFVYAPGALAWALP